MASGLRLSARVFFLISLAVCLLPRLCSTCGKQMQLTLSQDQKHELSVDTRDSALRSPRLCGCVILTLARNPPKWAPMLESTFFFLASSSALFLASSSSFLCLSSWGSHLQLITAVHLNCSYTMCRVWSEQIVDMHRRINIHLTMLSINYRDTCLSVALFLSPHTLLLSSLCPAALLQQKNQASWTFALGSLTTRSPE